VPACSAWPHPRRDGLRQGRPRARRPRGYDAGLRHGVLPRVARRVRLSGHGAIGLSRVPEKGRAMTGGPMQRLMTAWSDLVSAVRQDHATMQDYHDRYQSTDHVASLGKDLMQRVGFQIMASYRVMRFFHEARIPLAAKLTSRAIRV